MTAMMSQYELRRTEKDFGFHVWDAGSGKTVATEPSLSERFINLANPVVVEALREHDVLDAALMHNWATARKHGVDPQEVIPAEFYAR